MRIACVYSVESSASVDKPLSSAREIPFGISTIATVLQEAGHDVQLFVFSEKSRYRETLSRYIETYRPRLFCLTAVSTQFPFICKVAQVVKEVDPTAFVILGGHHASLNPESVLKIPFLDAICVGEGDDAVVNLADCIAHGREVAGIPNLWIQRGDEAVERNPPAPFYQDLDRLPYIDRKMWEPWIEEPHRYPSVLVGRGCPFRCAYCANHAMKRLAEGRYVRFRSPGSVVGEIEYICSLYPTTDSVYLEVETIGANLKESFALFGSLEEYNRRRAKPLTFGANFTVTSAFVRNKEQAREFLAALRRANVGYLNIGLESGSERVRTEVLHRPRYSNKELLEFAGLAKEHGINLNWYVLIGLPGETLDDYRETVRICREGQPNQVNLSIFYPYVGTDLYSEAVEQGLITGDGLDTTAERARAILDLPGFPSRRIRREYILFWYKAYRGHWPPDKILAGTLRSLIGAYPRLYSTAKYLSTHNRLFRYLRDRYAPRSAQPAKREDNPSPRKA